MARSKSGAVLGHDAMMAQVSQLLGTGIITSVGGASLDLKVDSLCVHGDNDAGIAAIADIRQLIQQNNTAG